jgi:hypothetical protein
LRNQDATGRISKWAVELSALNIDFKPRIAIKSQALVDFMAEWRENQLPTPTECPEHWVMYFDSSLNLEGAGARVLLISPMGEQLKYVLQIFWKVSNNEAPFSMTLVASHDCTLLKLLHHGITVILRRLDFALHVLRDVHLFFIVLSLAHQVCQPLSEPFHFLLKLIIFLAYEIITCLYNNILMARW